jgi:dipeptidyl aminopeptidase/acylaminoacyl peptidase
MKPTALFFILFFHIVIGRSQDALSYQTPPAEMAELLLAKPTASVYVDSKGQWMLLIDRNSYPPVEELAQPEFRVAGLRINPKNFSPSRLNFANNFTLKEIASGKTFIITGLPETTKATNILWSPGETKISFIQNNENGLDLYVIDIAAKSASRINKTSLNTVLGANISWIDENSILYLTATRSASSAPPRLLVPKGPSVQQSLGKTAPMVTYQDMIKTPYDEQVFAFYATAQLVLNKNQTETPIGQPAIYLRVEPSPDNHFLLMQTIEKPFSYLVPAYDFASSIGIYDLSGKLIKKLASLPSAEGTPSGYDNTQDEPREYAWRNDQAATIVCAHPLDSGRIKKQMDFHDQVYEISSPFETEPKELFKTQMRYRGIEWGNEELALVYEGLRSKQTVRVSRYNSQTSKLDKLYDLSETDAYHNPGQPVEFKNQFNRKTIQPIDKGKKMLLNNPVGSSPQGDLPFLSKYELSTGKNDIIWRCKDGYYEYVAAVLDPQKLIVLTRRETQSETPNYYLKTINSKSPEKQLTDFPNPYPQLKGVTHEKITYLRADSVQLSGDLYLPKSYNKDKDGPLPVLLWAYPREYNAGSDASQVRGSKYRFITLSWASPIFWVTQGYAVFDNAEMPIVSRHGEKPNDSFVEQLKLNAEAAINKLSQMGVGDSNRVAVGGHSYGAFMTANLLAHTHLFKAGIARSGAYNRTLTPFGFQNEERTYWDDPKLYFDMSPFSFANQIKTPLLLIHGDADDNTGTYPINSERLFNAIKGFGGTARLVFLPYEAHGYRGKENLLHMLWEMNQWLDTYVKHAK